MALRLSIRLKVLCFFLLPLSSVSAVLAQTEEDPPYILPPQDEINKLQHAILYTEKGDIYLELYPQDAPWHVANFKYLADKGYYHNKIFHLHHPGYIIQGGTSLSAPRDDPGYTLPPEFNRHKHVEGALGMARKADSINSMRASSGRQFYFVLGEAPKMNGAYTVFGKVLKGLDVVHSLERGDAIKELKVFVKP